MQMIYLGDPATVQYLFATPSSFVSVRALQLFEHRLYRNACSFQAFLWTQQDDMRQKAKPSDQMERLLRGAFCSYATLRILHDANMLAYAVGHGK